VFGGAGSVAGRIAGQAAYGLASEAIGSAITGRRFDSHNALNQSFGYALANEFVTQAQMAAQGQQGTVLGEASSASYVNEMDRASDSYQPAFNYAYRNEMDRASDAYNPAGAYGYRNGLDVQSDNYTPWGAMSVDELARRKLGVEDQVHLEILGQEAREASLHGAQMFMTGGPARGPLRGGTGAFEMVRNGNWDAALNIGADPYGVLPDLVGLQQDMSKMGRMQAESRINDMRQRMSQAGMTDVPTGYRQSLVQGGAIVRDYGLTVDDLQVRYEGFVRDKRLQETWGENYQSLRLGKSQMTVLEFEKRVLDVQQQATNRHYEKGVELIAKGDLPINGDYARTLGNYIDGQVRFELRGLAKVEGINDSMTSNMWAVNRSIRSDLVEGRGIPDNRLGSNVFADTSLARKGGYTEQIMKWNAIRPDANYLIIRPTNMPGGGSYVIPRASIQPFNPIRSPGRGL
jgi:hypothetical protein